MAPAASQRVVLDFDPNEVDVAAVAQTRRLMGQVLTAQGPTGLAKSLHVAASKATSLKHRVACVTCRSRLDILVSTLLTSTASEAERNKVKDDTSTEAMEMEGPLPLTDWLFADAGRGLAPAPRALRDLRSLSAFLAAFGSSAGTPGEDVPDGRSSGGGTWRCSYHSSSGCGVRCNCGKAIRKGASFDACCVADIETVAEKERCVSSLMAGTTEAEWRQLGSVDIDTSLSDLFVWLEERGLCPGCVDTVAGLLLEMRSAGSCKCGKCTADSKKAKSSSAALALPSGKPRVPGQPPEVMRVQGRLRAICGIYRIQPQTLNGHAVYKKDHVEAYLLYTGLKDWMFSRRPDAGGARCEGWAYVTDPAEFPHEVRGVWKVSGTKGWEEDPTLMVKCFEVVPDELKDLREGLKQEAFDAVTHKLCCTDGILSLPLQDMEVLTEVLWAPEEPLPAQLKTGGCAHDITSDSAALELRCWLRHLLQDRLDCQRKKIMAHGQVGASLCKLFACAALQQLEEAAEAPGKKDKKGRSKKAVATPIEAEMEEVEQLETPTAANADATACSEGSASTRASSEEPPDAEKAQLAIGARRLMEQMGWKPEAIESDGLEGQEVAKWHEQHPSYRQTVQEERQKLKMRFQMWALAHCGA